jgi:hypothetical protein
MIMAPAPTTPAPRAFLPPRLFPVVGVFTYGSKPSFAEKKRKEKKP